MKGAQLWKRILNEGVADRVTRDGDTDFVSPIIRAPIIVDDRQPERLDGVFRWEKFNAVAMPFNEFWVEWPPAEGCAAVGLLVNKQDTDDGEWLITMMLAMAAIDRPPLAAGMARFPMVKSTGSLVLEAGGRFSCLSAVAPSLSSAAAGGESQANNILLSNVDNCLDTLLMLGCRNVSLSPREHDAAQSKRAAKRCGGDPSDYRYHTLVVRPPGARKDSPATEIGYMPRHVCRGHFSEYGPDFGKGLLFGKYAGRFYVPPCLKGKKENGTVEKDYVIA